MGGVIFYPGEKQVISLAWVLGQRMNIQAKWAALMLGVEFMQYLGIHEFQVFSDSWNIIQAMHSIQLGRKEEIGKIQKRILTFVKEMDKVQFISC